MKKLSFAFSWIAVCLALGCSTSPTLVSERAVEDKVASVTPGQTTMADVQALFGPAHLKDARFWVYNLSDTEVDFTEFKTPIFGRTITPLPFSLMGNVPTNTRALITVSFNDAGVVKGFEVARYFSRPYIHDYRYLIKPDSTAPLDKVARLGEVSGFKVGKTDSSGSGLVLQEPNSKARISAAIEGETLHINSTNPYDRLSIEYRVFVKRETGFMESVSTSDFLQ